jgi:hypothetical protein
MKKTIALIVILCIVFYYLLNTIGNLKREKEDLLKLSSEFKTIVRKDSSTIAIQQQNILSQKEAIRLGKLVLEENMKKVQSQVTTKTQTKVEQVFIGYAGQLDSNGNEIIERDTLYMQDTTMLKVPKAFSMSNRFYAISGKVEKKGVMIDSISFPNETKVTIGYTRKNIFSKKESVVHIKNTNPYVQMQGMDNIIIKEKKPFYEKPIFLLGVGIIGGIFLIK